MPHIWLALSAHGYGHLAQVAPVVNALRDHIPELRLTVQTELPETLLADRLAGPLRRVVLAGDVSLPMRGPTAVAWDEVIAAVLAFHEDWPQRLDAQAALLRADLPDCVLADVPYLPLVVAAHLGVPAVAFCSLNWADILHAHRQAALALGAPIAVMREAYQGVSCFIQPAPSMPMPWIDRRHGVGPVAQVGGSRRTELLREFGLPPSVRFGVVSLGGIADTGVAHWPELEGVHWIVPDGWSLRRADLHPVGSLPYPFRDVLASADLLVTKPGYGSYVEAACLGLPVISVARDDWAETPYLDAWLQCHVPLRSISLADFRAGRLAAEVAELLAAPRARAIEPTGIGETVNLLLPYLARQ